MLFSSRAGELEADKLGMEVIIAAGYNPDQVLRIHIFLKTFGDSGSCTVMMARH